MKKYFKAEPYLRRIGLLGKLFRFSIKTIKDGTPVYERSTLKYDGVFEELFSRRERGMEMSLTKDEAYTLYSGALAVRHLEGAMAEVGVYRGGSARFICEAKGDKDLYLFDTFEGMPESRISAAIDTWQGKTHATTSIGEVRSRFSGHKNIYLVKGIFPDSISGYPEFDFGNKRFCFVNLDVDLYQSTLDALEYFYPRMVLYGRIVSHNYNLSPIPGGDTPGVKAAFMKYFGGKSEAIIEIADTQCMVIKSQ